MKYLVNAATDIGVSRNNNQDSVIIQLASDQSTSFIMAAVCDGMGGLSGGEIASSTVVCALKKWYQNICSTLDESSRIRNVSESCACMLMQLNSRLQAYERESRCMMGTTASLLLILKDEYAVIHIGDSRIYRINGDVRQLTQDHTVVARAVTEGRMTPEQAAVSKDRSKLTQCIGASKMYDPQLLHGRVETGDVFLLCSDGFYHRLTEEEMLRAFSADRLTNEAVIHAQCEKMIHLVIERREKDNISVAIVKAE